ncbi:MerR family transcriptional regulator [Aestuariibacter sp. AA17]|uniref:MerR family transcriptional regulator n=1 Tax=Fluctibacter corallii TaxID=2984329 RepID=A0ABT3A5G1_9ALTE|nr:MerR family transcriptional regulator [Aestuariibacter sp. AA17]MCV2883883.1 MerR family transcriptional regulator [Aestuariibacter sp. AA17]
MRIGELAKLSGIPTSTIRFYEQSGLLPPAKRLASGYRDYDERALDQINLIRFCQGLGFSLQELPELMGGCEDVDHLAIMDRLTTKLEESDEVIRQLTDNRNRLAGFIHRLNDLWSSGQCMSSEEFGSLLAESDVKIAVKAPLKPKRNYG